MLRPFPSPTWEMDKLDDFYQDGMGSSAAAPQVTHMTRSLYSYVSWKPETVGKLERMGEGEH